ncbi:hypothetical protein GCM10017687_00220 [Streptomyces echinatus]
MVRVSDWAAWACGAEAVPAIIAPAAVVPEYPSSDRLEILVTLPPFFTGRTGVSRGHHMIVNTFEEGRS